MEELREAFELAKEHLLSDKVGAIRVPLTNTEDQVYMFTDVSFNAYSALLTQELTPQKGGEKSLHILFLCWSAVVPKSARPQPIWLLKLLEWQQ